MQAGDYPENMVLVKMGCTLWLKIRTRILENLGTSMQIWTVFVPSLGTDFAEMALVSVSLAPAWTQMIIQDPVGTRSCSRLAG